MLQISMFLLDSEVSDAVAVTIAQRVRQALIQDSLAAAAQSSKSRNQPTPVLRYPACLLLEPGPALSRTMLAIVPLLTSDNELGAVAEHLHLHEALALTQSLNSLQSHVLSATIIRSNGTLDLVAGLCHGAPPATLTHILPILATSLPTWPRITHLRVPPAAFLSSSTLQPIIPFLSFVTRLTISTPSDATTVLADGYLHIFPSLVCVSCQPCESRDISLVGSSREASPSRASSESTSMAIQAHTSTDTLMAACTPPDDPFSLSCQDDADPACPATPRPVTDHPPASQASGAPGSIRKLLELNMTAPSLDHELPVCAASLLHLTALTVDVVSRDDVAESRGVTIIPQDAQPPATAAATPSHSPAAARAGAGKSILQLLPLCRQLSSLSVTLQTRSCLAPNASAEHAQHAVHGIAGAVPQDIRQLDLLVPGCPSGVVAELARLTALRHLGVHACMPCITLLSAMPHLTSLKLFVPPDSRESLAALDARLASASVARAALKNGALRRLHICSTAALRTADWRMDTGPGPPHLMPDLMHELMQSLQELRLTGAGDESCADAPFAAVNASEPRGSRGDRARVTGLERLQVPLEALSRVVRSGGFWEDGTGGTRRDSFGSAELTCPASAAGVDHAASELEPAARLRGLQELVVRRYDGFEGGRCTSTVLHAVAALTALRRLVLGGVDGVCAALRPLRALTALTALSLPDAVAAAADAAGLAAAAAALPALRELLVELDCPPATWEHRLAGFKPQSRDQDSACAEAEAAVEAAVEALRAQCWEGLCKLQTGPWPLRRVEVAVTATAADDFVMWLLSSGVGFCPRM